MRRRHFVTSCCATAVSGVCRTVSGTPESARLPDGVEAYDWALEQLRVPSAHRLHRGSKSTVVAVIDLGYRHHPNLDGHLWINPNPSRKDDSGRNDLHGWDFADNDGTLEFRGPRADSDYYASHHVFVAGEVAAVAPDCPIMILRVGYRTPESWHKAVRYAVENGAKVIVMPHGYIGSAPGSDVPLFYQGVDFAYPEDNPELIDALDEAMEADCLVFSGTADNRGRRAAFFPVAADAVCAVGSVNRIGKASNMATDADYVEFAAPAGEQGPNDPQHVIWGLGGHHGYVSFRGGCMAAGFAGGTAALIRSRFPQLNSHQVRQVLRNTSRFDGEIPRKLPDSKMGYGILDAEAAVRLTSDRFRRDVILEKDSIRIHPSGEGFEIRAIMNNQGVFDAERAMVVVYDGDPTRPKSADATFESPGPGLQTRQRGHAIGNVRGLNRLPITIAAEGPIPKVLFFEVYCLDHGARGVSRTTFETRT